MYDVIFIRHYKLLPHFCLYFQDEDEDGLVGEEEILDIDRAELMLAHDVGLDSDSEDGLDLEIHEPMTRSTRPVSGYRLTD